MTRVSATCLGLAAIAAGALLGAITAGDRGVATAATDPPLRTDGGIVASDDPIASRIGAKALARGGNAADAAAATALALGVVNPSSSGIGGGGFALVYLAEERKLYAIDFREVAPAALTPERFAPGGELDTSLSRKGGLAVGVPGEVAGLHHLVSRHGRFSWRRAVAPAQNLAHRGFRVPWFLARAASSAETAIDAGSPLDQWLRSPGELIEEGDLVRRRRLADTLSTIGRRGPDGFYRGRVADDIAATVRASGGVMTAADLARYRVEVRQPLVGSWRGYQVATMPLPSSGGVVLLEALGMLDASGYDLKELGAGSSAALHVTAEILKHAFADRSRFLGDDDPARLAREKLLDPARIVALGKRIELDKVLPHEQYGDQSLAAPTDAPATGGGTSHLCSIDADGNAVALTTTVNGYFGAKLMTADSGVVLNNEMDDFALRAGVPNMFGLVQSEHNLVGPGKRPLSSMSPTLVLEDGKVVACLGGSGGPRIISNTFQVLLNYFVFGMDAREAVGAPRIHHQWLPDTLVVEAAVPADVRAGLSERGHAVIPVPWRTSPTAVQAVFARPDGRLEAASDPRKRGAPAADR